jgi:hypothetical protein
MKPQQQFTIPEPGEPTLKAIGAWANRLFQLQEHLGPSFARPEVRAHMRLYLQALFSDIPRKIGSAPSAGPSVLPRSRCGITHLSVVAVSADAQELTIAVLEQAAEALQALCS